MLDPFNSLYAAISAACHGDLPPNVYVEKDWSKYNDWRKSLTVDEYQAIAQKARDEQQKEAPDHCYRTVSRNWDKSEVEVIMFPQMWSSTALGYGGIGGQAFTDAYTIIVRSSEVACVYFGGRQLAYRVNLASKNFKKIEKFNQDVAAHNMADVRAAVTMYPIYQEKQ